MPGRPILLDALFARRVLLVLTSVGALSLLLASFLPVLRLAVADPTVLRGQRTSYSGFDRHSVSLVLIALVALPAALLAVRGLRVAAFGVLLCALATLLIAVGIDLADLQRTGALGADLTAARFTAGSGYYFETLAGILLLLSAGGLIALQPWPAEPAPGPLSDPAEPGS
ncbi:MAG: hypothetical protein ACR2ND_06515 [Solirubrobacteraceae bacterium]